MRLLLLFLFGLQSLVSFSQSHLPEIDPNWAAAKAQYDAGNWEATLSIALPLLQNEQYRNISSEIAMLIGDCHLELGAINEALEKYLFALEQLRIDQEIEEPQPSTKSAMRTMKYAGLTKPFRIWIRHGRCAVSCSDPLIWKSLMSSTI